MYLKNHDIKKKLRLHLGAVASILIVVVLVGVAASSAAAQAPGARGGTVTTKVLVRGAPIHGTNGLRFDSQNRRIVYCLQAQRKCAQGGIPQKPPNGGQNGGSGETDPVCGGSSRRRLCPRVGRRNRRRRYGR